MRLSAADKSCDRLHVGGGPSELTISALLIKQQIKEAHALQIQTENLARGACLRFSNQTFEPAQFWAVFVKRSFLFRFRGKRFELNRGAGLRYPKLVQQAERHSRFSVRYTEVTRSQIGESNFVPLAD